MKKIFTIIGVGLVSVGNLTAQTNIGGVINTYTIVTDVNNCVCPTVNCANITITSAAGFSVNDRVLLIQMKGARVDSSNTAAHGSIINLYDAGNYEFADIASISGNVITTAEPLKETYFTNASPKDSACVQLIRVPVYSGNVNVTSTLTATAWNGLTGGVLAFEASGTVTLNADISVSGIGFQAANRLSAPSTCGNDTALYYQSSGWQHTACTGCGYQYDDAVTRITGIASYGGCAPGGNPCYTNRMHTNDGRLAGYRGEGVAANTFRKVFANGNIAPFIKGRGRWGSGGGGGGNHNGGGGGGANYGAGGSGGNAYNNESACPAGTLADRKGYGGAALVPTGSKIYMGGGGGEGHDNGGNGSTGAPGGGIIFIKASQVTNGGSYSITADGSSQTFVAFGDGSGGGGAGGSILLDISGGFTNSITASAKGGNGGSHNNNNCHGTGGGGGGGVIWFSGSSANVTTDVSGGANGTQVAASIDCGDINWGATAGEAGIVRTGLDAGYTAFFNMNTCSSGPLPIELVSFSATEINNKIHIEWVTASEKNNEYFIVEKSPDGKEFIELTRVAGAGNHSGNLKYSVKDNYPFPGINYYRLKQVDFDGTTTASKIVTAYFDKRKELIINPNPTKNFFTIDMDWHEHFDLIIKDKDGRTVISEKQLTNPSVINIQNINKGIYFVIITADDQTYFKKIVKSE